VLRPGDLGLGGLPFESYEVELPEGSLLALYTDGLIESRQQDVGSGLERLLGELSGAQASPDALCDEAVATLLPCREPAHRSSVN
jgi:serine phosphatase RsbU (regulator of sigma subunit)